MPVGKPHAVSAYAVAVVATKNKATKWVCLNIVEFLSLWLMFPVDSIFTGLIWKVDCFFVAPDFGLSMPGFAAPPRLRGPGGLEAWKERLFFFEKKNQETFGL
jgi:hypothetical protein